MKLTPQEYDTMIQKTVPPTQSGRTIPAAFLVGGLICVLGQALTDLYLLFLPQQQASTLASVTLVSLCFVHRPGAVSQASQVCRSRHPGTHHRLLQFRHQPGPGI